MTNLRRLLPLLVLVAACGDDERVPTDPDAGLPEPDAGDPDGCTAIELGQRDFQGNVFGQLTGVRYALTPALDGAMPDQLLVELYDSSTPGLPALTTGTFALGEPPNDSLATCQHCVWVAVDWDGFSPLETVFLATEGTLTLTSVEDPLTPVFAGSFQDVVLREHAFDENGVAVLVEDGRCLRAPDQTFDTTPTPGADCLSAEDCGNPLLEVCSPASATCTAPECGDFQGCPGDRPVCLTQYGAQLEGACYAACDPGAASPCDGDQVCRQLGVDPTFGVCMLPGEGELGDACPFEDIGTSCEPGMTCSLEQEVCTNTCAFFDAEPGCQADHACTVLGVCDPLSSGDDATFGEACDDDALMAQGCASDGGAFRGICFSYYDDQPKTCSETCLGDLGCEPEEFCAMRFSSGLGICLPDPVCGDGEVGEIDEICDDGDTESGDGCSGDCQTVEYDVICPAAPIITAGATAGDTSTAWDGFQASCQLGLARAEVYRFEASNRGRLRLTVDSPTLQVMSVRSDCEAAGSEAACATNDPFSAAEVIYQVTNPADLTVLVSAYTVLEEGPFTLNVEWVDESCGDGVVAGLEVCDDGNTDSDDGCAQDCLAIEYDYWCANAIELTDSATGDNTGGPHLYDAVCSNDVYGSGPDRLYTWTAPSTGTAQFRLEQGDQDLTLAVYDSCGTPASMTSIDCSSVYGVEEVEAEVTAGQIITILVEGFGPDAAGPFTLSAAMLP